MEKVIRKALESPFFVRKKPARNKFRPCLSTISQGIRIHGKQVRGYFLDTSAKYLFRKHIRKTPVKRQKDTGSCYQGQRIKKYLERVIDAGLVIPTSAFPFCFYTILFSLSIFEQYQSLLRDAGEVTSRIIFLSVIIFMKGHIQLLR